MATPSRRELAEAIIVLSGRMSGQRLSEAVAAYLMSQRRSSELDAIMREVSRLREQRSGVIEVTATSARPLDAGIRKTITDILQTKNIVINEVVDPTVLGGVRLESSEVQLDLTVRDRLNQLKAA